VRRFGLDWVLGRDHADKPVVMEDRCPHRSARLSLATIDPAVAGTLRCRYHGIRFDGEGRCVHVPELNRAAPDEGAISWVIRRAARC
jgi:phenylpropionate dioxygenase-like ring-hydroxylating dioxygenase large terminal subunit